MLSKTDFAQLEALVVRKGLPELVAREYKPSNLALLLDLPDCAVHRPGARPYVDELVADIARENKIKTVGLELMIEQIEVLNGLPRETERDLLIAILRQANCGEDFIATAVSRYSEATSAACSRGCVSENLFLALLKRRSRQPFSIG